MICEPCRLDYHTHCPELARQDAARFAAMGCDVMGTRGHGNVILAGTVSATELAGGQRCDCQHRDRRARADD